MNIFFFSNMEHYNWRKQAQKLSALTKLGFIWHLFISANNENASFKFLVSTQTYEQKRMMNQHIKPIQFS